MKKKKVFGSFVRRICGAAMCAKSAIAMRSLFQLSESPRMRRNRIERLPAAAAHVLDVHRRGAVLQDDEIDAA